MKAEESFKQELQEWAVRTADFYHEKATSGNKKYDMAFYTQSNLTDILQPPDLLILAINPGSGGRYEDQRSNETWKRWGLIDKMDGATLLKGNPMWEQRNKWQFWMIVHKRP
jgi:hypothetical protein